jgi:hypothetical protein
MDNKEEIWRDVIGYEGFYKVSNLGRIKSIDRIIPHSHSGCMTFKERIIKPAKNKGGYLIVILNKRGKTIAKTLHRLIAISFINNDEKKPQINHLNGDKLDNCVNNLEWCTQSENQIHAFKLGLNKGSHKGLFGEFHNRSKKVDQYDLNNNYIKTYFGISEAERMTRINLRCISNVCLGKQKTAGGFVWRYNNDSGNL